MRAEGKGSQLSCAADGQAEDVGEATACGKSTCGVRDGLHCGTVVLTSEGSWCTWGFNSTGNCRGASPGGEACDSLPGWKKHERRCKLPVVFHDASKSNGTFEKLRLSQELSLRQELCVCVCLCV